MSTSNEHGAGFGPSKLYFDVTDDRLFGDHILGAGTAGDVFEALQLPHHSRRIAGLPGRIAIRVTGLTVAMLTVTSIVIGLNKLRACHSKKARKR